MAIKGSLKEAGLPDVMQLLFLGRRTGCLALSDRQNFGYVYFDEGRITYAQIVNRRDRIGDLLVRCGRITPEQLQQAVALQAQDRERKLGELLVLMGAISREELEAQMRIQIEEAVYYLFTWTQGSFNFEAGVRPEREDFLVSINPEFLLLEGARRVDEWSLIEKRIPSFDLIFGLDPQHPVGDAPLTDEQRKLLPLLDGSRDVQELVDATGLVEFEVGKALYGLITAGFVQRVGTSQAAAAGTVTEARIEEHRNLGVAFYKTGMFDEAAREFRRVADLRPAEGSAPFYLGLIALRQARWADAAEAFRAATDKGGPRPATLHNLGLALEQLGRLDEAEAALGEAAGRARDDARVMLGWGVVALKRGEAAAAQARLQRARELLGRKAPPAPWWWAATLAAALAGEHERALALAREAVEAHPGRAPLRNNLAVLLEATGDAVAAETALREALKDDPSLPQCSKNLGDLHYRAGRSDEALDAYERAVKLAPDLGEDVHFKIGNIAFKRGDVVRARTAWDKVLALNPGHDLARANLELLEGQG